MRERTAFEIEELKMQKNVEQNGKCPVCGRYLTYGRPQLAHRIPQTKEMIAKYGDSVIHHHRNMVYVCSLKCNSSVNLGNGHQAERDELVREIQEDLCTEHS